MIYQSKLLIITYWDCSKDVGGENGAQPLTKHVGAWGLVHDYRPRRTTMLLDVNVRESLYLYLNSERIEPINCLAKTP